MAKTADGKNYIAVRMEDDQLKELEFVCAANMRSMSAQIRYLIRMEYLNLKLTERSNVQ